MKITFVLPALDMSGGNRVAAIYARKLIDRGHEVLLISPSQSGRRSLKDEVRNLLRRITFRAADKREKSLPIKSHVTNLGLHALEMDRWRPVVDSDIPDADVVIATWWETAEWVAALGIAKGVKVYFIQGHEVFPWLPVERCRATYRLPLYKIVVSRWLHNIMALEYGDGDAEIVLNGVDHDQFFATPRDKQALPTIGFLYSTAGIKGVDTVLRAIEAVRTRVPDLQVVSFGRCIPDPVIEARIDFHHDPEQSELAGLYAQCDVWLSASRSEGFNLPAMEAMACHTPVVSTRTGWPEEAIMDGINGYCVAIDDVEALANAVHRVLCLPNDQWRAMSKAACETVSNRCWNLSCDQFEKALVRAVERSGSLMGSISGTIETARSPRALERAKCPSQYNS